ncbi:FimV/HubP family polar landmark protein [Methylomonas sp. MgM2]
MKHLTKTLAVVSLFAPITAQALGIGDIELHSALNQQLNAEIRLHLAPGENPADINVKLASPEKFDKAGVPWNYFLSKIKFKPVIQPDGSIIIKVTSREILSEPFLDFLLEISWPQGSQFREYTVLLDPPEGYRPPVIPSVTGTPYQVEPLEDYRIPEPRPRTPRRKASRSTVASNITPQTPISGEYGPTKNADTLWRIAEQLGAERGVPTNSMMMALFRANPEAFIRGDINTMKVDVVLKIPETEAILQTGKATGPTQTARKEKQAPPKTDTAAASKALELVAPTDAKIPETAQFDEQPKPGSESGEHGKSVAGDEEMAPGGDKSLELQSRIDRLEQQINMMQQMLALKDQQLAALQNKDAEAAQQVAETAKNLQTTQPVAPEVKTSEPTAETQVPEQTATPTLPKPEAKPAVPLPPSPVEEGGDFFSSTAYYVTLGGLGGGILALLAWLLWRKQQTEKQIDAESMFATASQIKLPDTDSSLSVPVLDMSSTSSYDVGTVGESSFISDFTPSDFEAFDTDQTEVDPMSEADVYLAYGRYQQAEDLMRQAISEQPNKDEYKLKLLEIFYANENKERFAAYTNELAEAGKTADLPFWTKVADMAKEIIPESPLFGGTGNTVSDDEADTPKPNASGGQTGAETPSKLSSIERINVDDSDSDSDLADLEAPLAFDDETDEFDAELNLDQFADAQDDDNSLDFDLGSFSEIEKQSPPENVKADKKDDIESIDFDLSRFEDETPTPTEDTKKSASDAVESFDFNFDMDSESEPSLSADEPSPTKEESALENLEEFDFSELGGVDAEEDILPNKPEPIDTEISDDFDFNFDFGTASAESSDDELDLGVTDLTDMDEFETKIDLAKAYIDMGDSDAAKTIAEEVLEKGNPDQKQAAQAILDELG